MGTGLKVVKELYLTKKAYIFTECFYFSYKCCGMLSLNKVMQYCGITFAMNVINIFSTVAKWAPTLN